MYARLQLRLLSGELFRLTEQFRVPRHLLVRQGAETALQIVSHQKERPADDVILQPPIGCHAVELPLIVAAEQHAVLHIHRLEQPLHLLLDGFQSVRHLLHIGCFPRFNFQYPHFIPPFPLSATVRHPQGQSSHGWHSVRSRSPAAPAASAPRHAAR